LVDLFAPNNDWYLQRGLLLKTVECCSKTLTLRRAFGKMVLDNGQLVTDQSIDTDH
jgi:hypothetical protein